MRRFAYLFLFLLALLTVVALNNLISNRQQSQLTKSKINESYFEMPTGERIISDYFGENGKSDVISIIGSLVNLEEKSDKIYGNLEFKYSKINKSFKQQFIFADKTKTPFVYLGKQKNNNFAANLEDYDLEVIDYGEVKSALSKYINSTILLHLALNPDLKLSSDDEKLLKVKSYISEKVNCATQLNDYVNQVVSQSPKCVPYVYFIRVPKGV